MQLNLPPRLLRVMAGCATAALVAGLTFTALARDYTSHPLRLGPLNTTIELPRFPEFVPTWTTGQLEPRFAYAQYATTIDYLCNAVSKAILIIIRRQ